MVWHPLPPQTTTTTTITTRNKQRIIWSHLQPPSNPNKRRRWNTPHIQPIVSLQQQSSNHQHHSKNNNCCESSTNTTLNHTTTTTTTLLTTTTNIMDASNTNTSSSSSSTTAATLSFFNQHHYLSGIWVLFTVPLAWGTYTPVVKYLYTIQQPPIPGILFSAAYYIIAAITLWTIFLQITTTNTNTKDVNESFVSIPPPTSLEANVTSDNVQKDNTISKMIMFAERNDHVVPITSTTITTSDMANDSNSSSSSSLSYWYGGIELGMYLFIANLLQIIGLQSVPADRAGFLIQLTTIFVPLLEAVAVVLVWYQRTNTSTNTISNGNAFIEFPTMISPRTWMACLLAFVGVFVFDQNVEDILPSISTTTTTASTILQDLPHILWNTVGHTGTGDSLIIAAAVLYSLHVIRLGRYAKVCDALPLAASKATVEAILSIGLVGILTIGRDHNVPSSSSSSSSSLPMNGIALYVAEAGQEIQTFLTSITTLLSSNGMVDTVTTLIPALCAILWTGWVTCAYTIFAQSYGQSRVPPTEANLVYSIQPLCTALFAYVLLGETLSPSGFVGAAFIAAAVYIVAVPEDKGSVE